MVCHILARKHMYSTYFDEKLLDVRLDYVDIYNPRFAVSGVALEFGCVSGIFDGRHNSTSCSHMLKRAWGKDKSRCNVCGICLPL